AATASAAAIGAIGAIRWAASVASQRPALLRKAPIPPSNLSIGSSNECAIPANLSSMDCFVSRSYVGGKDDAASWQSHATVGMNPMRDCTMANDERLKPGIQSGRMIPTDPSGPQYASDLDRYLDRLLDEALEETFPATDAPAVPRRRDGVTG